jgi:hypothetical protein
MLPKERSVVVCETAHVPEATSERYTFDGQLVVVAALRESMARAIEPTISNEPHGANAGYGLESGHECPRTYPRYATESFKIDRLIGRVVLYILAHHPHASPVIARCQRAYGIFCGKAYGGDYLVAEGVQV